MFLPYTCDIYSTTISEVRGATVKSETNLGSDLPCMFYISGDIQDTKLSQETDKTNYTVILGNFVNVKQGDIIEPKDKLSGSFGKYYVKTVNVNYSKITNGFDNLEIKLSKSND